MQGCTLQEVERRGAGTTLSRLVVQWAGAAKLIQYESK